MTRQELASWHHVGTEHAIDGNRMYTHTAGSQEDARSDGAMVRWCDGAMAKILCPACEGNGVVPPALVGCVTARG